jgi:hypothetical protein
MRLLAFLAFEKESAWTQSSCEHSTMLQKQGRTTNEKKGIWGAGFLTF